MEPFRITNEDIARSSTLDKTDWNKYAIMVAGCIQVIGSKKAAIFIIKTVTS